MTCTRTSAELETEARSPKSAAKRNAKVLATSPLICVQKKVQKRARVASTPASYWVTKDAGRVAASFDHEDELVKLAAPLPVAHGPGSGYVLRLTEVRADDDHDYKRKHVIGHRMHGEEVAEPRDDVPADQGAGNGGGLLQGLLDFYLMLLASLGHSL